MSGEARDKGAELSDAGGGEAADSGPHDLSPDEVEGLIETLRQEKAQMHEQCLRLAAEIDNLRKRGQRELENARKYGIERFAASLLPVFDSLEAALAAENLDVETLLAGERATLRLLEQAFRDAGIEPIDPHGEPFDPTRHEAMSILPAPHAEPDSVVEVVQKGYAIRDRLLRPARVVVAKPEEPPSD